MTRALIGSLCIVLAGLGLVVAALSFSPEAIGQSPGTKPAPAATKPAPAPRPPATPASAQPTLAIPPAEVLLVLIRTTLIALNQAVQTGNFTVLRDLGAPSFQASTPTQLGLAFADLRNRNIDLSPVVVVTPEVSETPSISPDNILRLVGQFPTSPLQIRFQLLFQPVNGQWRLYGLAVDTPPAPQASTEPAPPAPAPAPVAKPPTPAKPAAPPR
jgi:hypothetical protein